MSTDKPLGSKLKVSKVSERRCEEIRSGYVTKMGQVVKNWKVRWLSLSNDGILKYYKKEPKSLSEKAQGEIDVQKDIRDILLHHQIVDKDSIKWPSEAEEGTGFGLVTVQGRVFYMYCDSIEEAERWVTMLANVAANARYEDGGVAITDVRTRRMSIARPTPSTPHVALEKEPEVTKEETDVCYVHKVVGGMIIKERHIHNTQ